MKNNQKQRMLITGVSGLLGNNLAFCWNNTYDILGTYHTHSVELDGIQTCRMDLNSRDDVDTLIKEFNPDVLVHCAAEADVEVCENNPEHAERVNILGTRNLVKSLKDYHTKFISISTDLVYDGVKGHFSEEESGNPPNAYGMTKCKAEEEAARRKQSMIVRTNFFGWNIQAKYSLGEWVIHQLKQKKESKGFTDCFFSSIYTFELAKILDLAIRKNLCGIYNCASSTFISKYEFISEIAKQLDLDTGLIQPSSVNDFGFKAKRVKNMSLNTGKLARDLSTDIPSIAYSIERFVEDFNKGIPERVKANASFTNVYPYAPDFISYGRQSIDEDDIAAVVETLKSLCITQGSKVIEFESALCQLTGASFATAVNSGTAALHIACKVAGIGPGDEVITSPNTFVASANCVVYCGGTPVFADIDPQTYNVSVEEIERKINERTKAIIPVHFAGQSCDMETIRNIVRLSEKKYGHKIYMIEDACHALGSLYKETKVGSCAYSDMATMSFHPVKHITTGEGGIVLTNDSELKKRLDCVRSHGITSEPDEFSYSKNGLEDSNGELVKKPWYYEQNFLGYNYRITDIQCALGVSQLKKVEQFAKRRRAIINQYDEAFKGVEGFTIPFRSACCHSNFHLYVLKVDFEKIGLTRMRFIMELKKRKIQTQVHYIPVYTQPFYRKKFQTNWGDCPHTEEYYKQALSIPLYPQMRPKDVERVILAIKELAVIPEGM